MDTRSYKGLAKKRVSWLEGEDASRVDSVSILYESSLRAVLRRELCVLLLSRRTLILGALSVSFAPAGPPAAAEPLRFLSVTQQLADVLDAVAKGIKDLGDAFAHLVARESKGTICKQPVARILSSYSSCPVGGARLWPEYSSSWSKYRFSIFKNRAQVETARNDIDADWKNVIGAADAASQYSS